MSEGPALSVKDCDADRKGRQIQTSDGSVVLI